MKRNLFLAFSVTFLAACATAKTSSPTLIPSASPVAFVESTVSPSITPPETTTPTSPPPTSTSTPSPTTTPPESATPTSSRTPGPTATATSELPCPPWTWTTSGCIRSDWPAFTFKLVGMDCGDFVEGQRIEVYRGDAAQPSQVIEGQFVAQMLKDTDEGFEIVDMNFDGYQDIRLLDEISWGSSGVLFRHWLFDPQTQTFVPNEAMNMSIGRAEFDAEQGLIRVYWRAGPGGYAIDYYCWVDGELTFIKQEERQAIAEGVELVTVWEQLDGKQMVQQKKIVREGGLDALWLVLSELGDNFTHLAAASTGEVWAVGRDGLFQFDGQAWTIFDLPAALQEKISADTRWSQTITDLVVAANNVVWLGTRQDGLYRFADGTWRHHTTADGLPYQAVRHLAIDAQDQLWAVFVEGDAYALARFDGGRWQPFPLDNVERAPNGVAVSPTGEVWLSVPEKGPYLFDGGQWFLAVNGWDAGSMELYLAAGLTGDIWFGSDYSWMRWTGQGWGGIRVTIPAPFSYPAAVDADGGAWGIVTPGCYGCKMPNYNENGAVYVTPNRSCRFTAADGLGDPPLDPPPDPLTDYETPRPDVVRDIAAAVDGRVWFITQGKITVFSPQDPVCDYAAPGNVRTPEEPDLSTCPTQPGRFAELWQARMEDLGCPVAGTDQPMPMAEQTFEWGWMLWRGDTATILVLPIGRRQLQFEDSWDPTQPVYTCPDLAPSQTPPTPQRGLGKVWCLEEGVRDLLGQAISEEHAFEASIQAFEYGSIFATDESVTYVVETWSDWERLE